MRNPETATDIHPTAVVHSSAELGINVEIGPYCVVGPNVRIGDGCKLGANVVIEEYTTLGADCQIMSSAVLGGLPQDRKFGGERTYLIIGDNNVIREFVTIHRASGEEKATVIGDHNMLMAYCHIGHNCQLGSYITMANMVGLSGHTIVEDRVCFGGMVGVHQFVRIGKLAMVGGLSKIIRDIPPFMIVDGRPGKVYDLNVIGLRRNGIPEPVRTGLSRACKLLYHSDLNVSQALEAIDHEVEPSEELEYLLSFVKSTRLGYGGRQQEPPRF